MLSEVLVVFQPGHFKDHIHLCHLELLDLLAVVKQSDNGCVRLFLLILPRAPLMQFIVREWARACACALCLWVNART